VVDTHPLIWYVENNPRLGVDAGQVLDDPSSVLFLPTIALAEACWIVEHGRSQLASVSDLLADLDGDPRITRMALDRDVLDIANTLTAIGEMHDRQIIATALRLGRTGDPVALLTRDHAVRLSGLTPVVW
jgi:PIN domain nuclease of toxin-antitoxin system